MTAADQIAADLRDAFRRIAVLDVPVTVRASLRRAHEANDFDSAMSNALSTIVALDDAEAAAAAEMKAAQARMATVTEASAKAREALRAALDACGGPGAAEAESEFHKAILKKGSTKVEITDESALPEAFIRTKKEPARDLIKATLALKKPVPGAALVQSPATLVISVKDR